jgi:Leucine-rich repeat (LRR) protein
MFKIILLVIFILLNISTLILSECINGSISEVELEGLYIFYNMTNGNYWNWKHDNLPQWIFPSTIDLPCYSAPRHSSAKPLNQSIITRFLPWQGLICNQTSIDTCTITGIILPHYNLNGPIPNLSYFINLTILDLQNNSLISTLPNELYLLPNLEEIYLNTNYLGGSISSSISNGLNIKHIEIYLNYLSNRIPNELYSLSNLKHLDISNNYITGTISPLISNLIQLNYLTVFSNNINGSIPESLYELTNLRYFDVGWNNFHGSLSKSVSNLTKLNTLYLNWNNFSSSIPQTLDDLSHIIQIDLAQNHFTGSIPDFKITKFYFLTFNLAQNNLTGPIPSSIGNIKKCQTLSLSDNSLSGLIPSAIIQLNSLNNLLLENNKLEGNLNHIDFSRLKTLTAFIVNNNRLSSSLPSLIGELIDLKYFLINDNLFTSSLPTEVGKLKRLQQISLNNNKFTGSLPNQLFHLRDVRTLNLSTNGFEGNFFNVWEYNTFLNLTTIDLSFNKITGRISSNLFANKKKLETVNLMSNCMNGELPNNICDASKLSTIALDLVSGGLQCSSRTNNYFSYNLLNFMELFGFEFIGYTSSTFLTSSIPNCIWNLSNLEVLHLAGNSLTGTLGELSPNSLLKDINLANNKLTNKIPLSWQYKGDYIQLDLKNNFLDGELVQDFNYSNNYGLYLNNNRLSGIIPPVVYEAIYKQAMISSSFETIDLLHGNLFQCDQDSLPENLNYECGSNSFNLSLIVFSCLIVVMGIILFISLSIIPRGLDFEKLSSKKWLQILYVKTIEFWNYTKEFKDTTDITSIYRLSDLLMDIIISSFKLIGIFIFICLNYITIKLFPHKYSSYTNQYTWITSSVFLCGLFPAVLVNFYANVCVSFILKTFTNAKELSRKYINIKKERIRSTKYSTIDIKKNDKISCSWIKDYSILMMIQFVNILATVLVNTAYISNYNSSSNKVLFIIQMSVGIYKIVWNRLYIYYASRKILKDTNISLQVRFMNQLFMSIFIYIIGPILVTLFTESNCFQYVFEGEPHVEVNFIEKSEIPTLHLASIDGIILVVFRSATQLSQIYASLQPPFTYSIECSSAVLTKYIPVLVYSFSVLFIQSVFVFFFLTFTDHWKCKELNKLHKTSLELSFKDFSMSNNPILSSFYGDTRVTNEIERNTNIDLTFSEGDNKFPRDHLSLNQKRTQMKFKTMSNYFVRFFIFIFIYFTNYVYIYYI